MSDSIVTVRVRLGVHACFLSELQIVQVDFKFTGTFRLDSEKDPNRFHDLRLVMTCELTQATIHWLGSVSFFRYKTGGNQRATAGGRVVQNLKTCHVLVKYGQESRHTKST